MEKNLDSFASASTMRMRVKRSEQEIFCMLRNWVFMLFCNHDIKTRKNKYTEKINQSGWKQYQFKAWKTHPKKKQILEQFRHFVHRQCTFWLRISRPPFCNSTQSRVLSVRWCSTCTQNVNNVRNKRAEKKKERPKEVARTDFLRMSTSHSFSSHTLTLTPVAFHFIFGAPLCCRALYEYKGAFYLPMFSRFVVFISVEIIGSFYVTVAVAIAVATIDIRRIISIISIIVVSIVTGILMYFESQVIAISG